jgi:hypothetical protein
MKKLLIGIAAAATLITATPALAQVGVDIGPGGFSVGVGPRHDRDDWRWRHRRGFRSDVYGAYGGADCREVTIKKRLPDGSLRIRRFNRCD